MGVNVAAHTRHIFLGSAPPGVKSRVNVWEILPVRQVCPTPLNKVINGMAPSYLNQLMKVVFFVTHVMSSQEILETLILLCHEF